MLLRLYRAVSAAAGPLAAWRLRWLAFVGLEDHSRIPERLGRTRAARPEGALAWICGAGAEDAAALLPLIERLTASGLAVLLTTRDAASAAPLRLPPRAAHQIAPLDAPQVIKRFLDHWRPNFVLISGPMLQPNLIVEASRRNIALTMVNARLSARSFLLWRRFGRFVRPLLQRVDLCLAQTESDAERFGALGARRALAAGDPLYDFAPPPADPTALARLVARIGARPAWFAAATWPGEDEIVLEVHRRLIGDFPDLVTILAPRQAKRGPEIALRATRLGLSARLQARESDGESMAGVYVAGAFGEASVFYRAVGVVFMGKSLSGGGGENPVAPARLGCVILHGPHVGDFAEAYAALDQSGGGATIDDAETLASELALILYDAAELRAMCRAAAETMEALGGATGRIMQAIEPLVAQAMISAEGARR